MNGLTNVGNSKLIVKLAPKKIEINYERKWYDM